MCCCPYSKNPLRSCSCAPLYISWDSGVPLPLPQNENLRALVHLQRHRYASAPTPPRILLRAPARPCTCPGACRTRRRPPWACTPNKTLARAHLRALVHLQARAGLAVDHLGRAPRAPPGQRLHDAHAPQPPPRAHRAAQQPLRERAARPEIPRVQLDLLRITGVPGWEQRARTLSRRPMHLQTTKKPCRGGPRCAANSQ